jgi:hypothetical protein
VAQTALASAAHARLLGLPLHDVLAAQVELVLGERDCELEQQLLVQRLEVVVGHAVGVDDLLEHLVHVGHALLGAQLGEQLVQAAAAAASRQEAAAVGDGDLSEDVASRVHAHPPTARRRFVVVEDGPRWRRRLLFVRVFARGRQQFFVRRRRRPSARRVPSSRLCLGGWRLVHDRIALKHIMVSLAASLNSVQFLFLPFLHAYIFTRRTSITGIGDFNYTRIVHYYFSQGFFS